MRPISQTFAREKAIKERAWKSKERYQRKQDQQYGGPQE